MRKTKQALVGLLLALSLLLSLSVSALGAGGAATPLLEDTAAYLQKTVSAPGLGSVGGEWAVLGLARSGCAVPQRYFDTYYANLETAVRQAGGVLHKRKYTEYSRVVLALTALGKDPRDVAGYDLLQPLGDFDQTVWQGLNGAIYALLALDSGAYAVPETASGAQASRQAYVDHILSRELAGGGWALSGTAADADLTAMALQALAPYRDQAAVAAAAERALTFLSTAQQPDGGFLTVGADTCESAAQVLVALAALGIAPEDSRFVKNGLTALDHLLSFAVPGGGFAHLPGDAAADGMATEQAFCALAAVERLRQGETALYDMSDVPGRAAFSDVQGHPSQAAIEALAAAGLIHGMGDGTFAPDRTMTRAELCTMVVNALGLTPKVIAVFSDVPADAWYAPTVGAAYEAGLVNGVGDGLFDPESTITRQEVVTLLTRMAARAGLDTAVTPARTEEILSAFPDGDRAADYARASLAFCYDRRRSSSAPCGP